MKKISVFLLTFSLIFSTLFIGGNSKVEAAQLNGGYVKSTYYAQGGRVNIEYQDFYLNVADARTLASKSEQSAGEILAWLRVSFIKGINPYVSGFIGSYRALEAASFASSIRKYTDKNQKVHVTIWRDKFHGVSGRTVAYWNGDHTTVKPFAVPAPKYQKVVVKKFK